MAVLLTASLSGCRLERVRAIRPLQGNLYVAVGVSNDALDSELEKDIRQNASRLESSFRALHPRVRLQVQVYPEDRLEPELQVRNRAGLSPDLLLVNGTTARELMGRRLIRPVRFPQRVTDALDPVSVARLRRPDGTLLGLPTELQPQLACFDRRRVRRSPTSLTELLEMSARGMEVGLPIDAIDLAWTLGPLGALDSVGRILQGQPVSGSMHAAVESWLRWIRAADQQQHITFFANQTQLLDQLLTGSVDWIPCRSVTLTRLKARLGANVGVAPLPVGPGGPASPVSRERVLAFGVNSSPGQQQLAEALARFAVTPLHQRALVLGKRWVLPVNLEVTPPVSSSSVIAAMVASQAMARRSGASLQRLEGTSRRIQEGWQAVLTRYLFGDLPPEAAVDALIELLQGREAS
ncbi:MAG: hypothetical protein ER33_12290 [Cyanobium sp. CACIAM 14]|nr:MAG: hypothetical protein ER33_12290 [Cyanobium sp. CACIAM 14]